MGTIIVGIFTGIISSLLASSVFLLVLYRIKPNILISRKISKHKIGERTVYQIKIANFTSRPVVDVNYALYRVRRELMSSANGKSDEVKWLSEVNLRSVTKRIPELSAFNPCPNNSGEHNTDYACRIQTEEDIEAGWVDGKTYLRFVVYATDSLSGLNQVFSHEYTYKNECLLLRPFRTGDLLEVWRDRRRFRQYFAGKTKPGFIIRLRARLFCHESS